MKTNKKALASSHLENYTELNNQKLQKSRKKKMQNTKQKIRNRLDDSKVKKGLKKEKRS